MCSHSKTSLGVLPGFLTEATVVASWMKYIPALQRQSGTLKASSNIYKSLRLAFVLFSNIGFSQAYHAHQGIVRERIMSRPLTPSRHIPHVKFAGLIHPGILGCAPSAEVLATWNKREGELIAANKLDRIVAQPPEPQNVHAGSATDDIKAKVGKEGARTIPGRPEHGILALVVSEK